jgi:hypothetical protein
MSEIVNQALSNAVISTKVVKKLSVLPQINIYLDFYIRLPETESLGWVSGTLVFFSVYLRLSQPVFLITEQWMKKIESYRDWFKEQETVKADEAKRPGKPKTHDDLFGMEGSFKQLSID